MALFRHPLRELPFPNRTNQGRDSDFYQSLKLRELYPKIVLKGGIKVGTRETVVLEAPRAGNPKRWYFDSASGLLIRTEERQSNGEVMSWEDYADYKPVDGAKVPLTIRVWEEMLITIKVTEVRIRYFSSRKVSHMPAKRTTI